MQFKLLDQKFLVEIKEWRSM